MESEETLQINENSLNKILEEIKNLRQETNQQFVDLRQEMNLQIGDLRQEMNLQIGDLRQEMNQQVGDSRQETNQQIGDLRREMRERFTRVDTEIEEVKLSQFSTDVRLERALAMAHDALNIGHSLTADVKILTAEVRAWAADVVNLQEKV